AQRGPDGADDVPGARPAMRASARTEGPGRSAHAGSGAPPGGSPDTPRKTEGGWLPHAPGALPGGLAQEAPDGL
ncbi:RNA polymerase sigma factor, partial [Paraburkholderia hospita]